MTQLTRNSGSDRAEFDRPLLLTPSEDLAGFAAKHAGQALLFLVTCVSVLSVMLIFVFIAREAIPFFASHSLKDFLASPGWHPTTQPPQFGILMLLGGSLYVTLGAMLVAVPVALSIAVFLSDIAPFRLRQIIKPLLEMLAAIPSVAYGFFAVLVIAPWMQDSLGMTSGRNVLNASIILAVMAVPTIASVSEDALASIGRELREGSYALGATRAETIIKVIIPAAHSGIIAGVILGMMRAVGETMVVWMASGNATHMPTPWWDLSQSVRTITATVAQDMGESAGAHRLALFAMAAVLLAITFGMNLAGEYFLARARQQAKWSTRRHRKHSPDGLARLWSHVSRGWEEISVRYARILLPLRLLLDKAFTAFAGSMVLLMLAALSAVLGPMLYKGASAVVFRDTVEFRNYQYQAFGRGDLQQLSADLTACREERRKVYAILDRFSRGIDPAPLSDEVKTIHRQLKKQLDSRDIPEKDQDAIIQASEAVRDDLRKAFESSDRAVAVALLDGVLARADDPALKGTVAERYFTIARDYKPTAASVDMAHRDKYAKSLAEVQAAIEELLGPREGAAARSDLQVNQYGATRWDRALTLQHQILWADNWISGGEGKPAVNQPYRREQDFAGTEIASIFPLIEHDLDKMLRPQWTCYWRFFTDNSQPGHLLGGIGPEIWGTLLLSVLTMLFAVPLGVISAGYLVECGGDNIVVRTIRTCVNTLAGVPSIVFGLFGLVFFVLVFLPMFGLPTRSSIWAGALTLAMLVLPIMIRSSEEAIRAVPVTYKEAALALGAGKLRTFVTVTLPAAMPGILTGAILSLSRAAGETAAILFCAGAAWTTGFATSLGEETRTLSYGSYTIAVVEPEAAKVPHNQYGMVMTLVVLVLVLNLAAIVLRSRIAKRLRGH